MLSVPETLIRVNNKYSTFKVLTVARKLSQITDLDNYDFDSDFNTNSENAECMVVGSGDLGTGLFTRNAPPTWEDFEQYATICQVIEDPIKSSISGDFCFCSGNQPQNAVSGQTNYYFDCQQSAVANLPQFDYTRIHAPNDGYVWAFDVWLTPFKPYTFALFQWGSATYFQWYGGGNLIQPSFVDGGSLPGDEPILSGDDTFLRIRETGVRYYAGALPQQVNWNAVDPSNIKIVPAVMDNKIALNINWFMTTNNTNMMMGHNLACSNTYRDDTTISGGTLQDDILYEGILKKYYGENEGIEGETEEPHFEEDTMVCVYRECSISDLLSYYGYSSSTLTSNRTLSDSIFDRMRYDILSQSFMSRPVFLKDIKMEEYQETYTDFVENRQIELNDNAWEQVPMTVPKQQESVPHPLYAPYPENPFGNSGRVYEDGDYHYDNFNYKIGAFRDSVSGYDTATDYRHVHYMSSGDYANTDANKYFNKSFSETWGNEWTEEMIPLEFSDDDKVRFYSFYVDKEKLKQPITIFTYYNKHLPQNKNDYSSDDKIYDSACCFPYMSGCITYNYKNSTYLGRSMGINSNPLKRNNQYLYFTVGCHYSNTIFSQNFLNDNEVTKKNIVVAGDIDDGDQESIKDFKLFVCKCEVANYTLGESTQFFKNGIAIYTPYCDWAYVDDNLHDTWHFEIGLSTSFIVPYESSTIEDPIQKGSNGNIPRDNPDENAGAGCDDKSPESLGTNRTHIEPDKPLPPISTNIFASGLLSLYSIDNANLTKLGGDLFSNNIFEQIEHGVQKPIDCILRVAESRISPITESTPRAIKLGSATLSAFGNRATKTYKTVNCGEVIIQRINGDYTDNDEKIMVYLPYIGFKQLDGNILQNTKLKLEYIFNFLNGTCIANLQWSPVAGNPVYENAKGKWAYLTSFTGEFITTFPIGTSSNTGLLSTLMSAGLGVMTHNAYYARASIRSLPNSFYPTFEHTGEFGANCSNMINRLQPYIYKFSLRHTFPHNTLAKTTIENNSGKINGLFTSKYITISKDIYTKKGIINGFIQCDNFEFKNTPTSITADECEMLKNLFNEGVWAE